MRQVVAIKDLNGFLLDFNNGFTIQYGCTTVNGTVTLPLAKQVLCCVTCAVDCNDGNIVNSSAGYYGMGTFKICIGLNGTYFDILTYFICICV